MGKGHGENDAKLLWAYRLECYARSSGYKRAYTMFSDKPHGGGVESAERREEIASAPVIPIDSDGHDWVTLKIDLTLPPRFVLPMVEQSLRHLRDSPELARDIRRDAVPMAVLESLKANRQPYRSLFAPSPKERIHIKRLKRALTVWDLCQEHKVFRVVARKVRSKVSTVRDLYYQAAGDILQINSHFLKREGGTTSGDGSRRKRVIPQGFDFHKHLASCPVCSATPDSDRWCEAMRGFAFPEEFAQREKTLDDPIKAEEISEDRLPAKSKRTPQFDKRGESEGLRLLRHKRTR